MLKGTVLCHRSWNPWRRIWFRRPRHIHLLPRLPSKSDPMNFGCSKTFSAASDNSRVCRLFLSAWTGDSQPCTTSYTLWSAFPGHQAGHQPASRGSSSAGMACAMFAPCIWRPRSWTWGDGSPCRDVGSGSLCRCSVTDNSSDKHDIWISWGQLATLDLKVLPMIANLSRCMESADSASPSWRSSYPKCLVVLCLDPDIGTGRCSRLAGLRSLFGTDENQISCLVRPLCILSALLDRWIEYCWSPWGTSRPAQKSRTLFGCQSLSTSSLWNPSWI